MAIGDNIPKRLSEIFRRIETLRAQSLSSPDKAADALQDVIGELQVSLEGLTTLAGGGHDRRRAGCIC